MGLGKHCGAGLCGLGWLVVLAGCGPVDLGTLASSSDGGGVGASALRVSALTTSGDTSLGYLSVSAGCPATVSAELTNAGSTALTVNDASLALSPATVGVTSTLVGLGAAHTLAAGSSATVTFRIDAAATVAAGVALSARAGATATEVSSGATVAAGATASPVLSLAASGARLWIVSVASGSGNGRVRAGDTAQSFRVRLTYTPAAGSGTALTAPTATLLATPAATTWPQSADTGGASTIPVCAGAPTSCSTNANELRLRVDIPAAQALGVVTLTATGRGTDTPASGSAVVLCGASDPSLPAATVQLEVTN